MRIHCIIHAAFEGLGVIETWGREKGYMFSETHTYKVKEKNYRKQMRLIS